MVSVQKNPIIAKQPSPSLPEKNKNETDNNKRVINRPNVGIVNVPKISTTPLSDTLSLKKQDTPRTLNQYKKKKPINLKFHAILSAITTISGIACLISCIRKKA